MFSEEPSVPRISIIEPVTSFSNKTAANKEQRIFSGHLAFDPDPYLEDPRHDKHYIKHSEADKKFKYILGLEGDAHKKTEDILSNEIPSIKLSKAEKFERAMKNIFDKKVDNSSSSTLKLLCKKNIYSIFRLFCNIWSIIADGSFYYIAVELKHCCESIESLNCLLRAL